jgi:hypothetical protein
MPPESPADKRIKPRQTLRLRVDARLIKEQERDAILEGLGFPDLENEGLALSRPRHGLKRSESRDVSASGLRIKLEGLDRVDIGRSMSLDVHVPGEHRVVKLLGDVVWVGTANGEPVAGLRIAALDEEGLRRLMAVLV